MTRRSALGWLMSRMKFEAKPVAKYSRQDFTCGKCGRHHINPEEHPMICKGRS